MKINTFIAVASFLLVTTYSLVARIQPDEPSNMTKCIPSTALAYFEEHNLATLSETLAIASLGRKVQSIDFAAVSREIGATEETIAGIRHLEKTVKSIQNDPLIQTLCGNKFALAILPPLGSSLSSQGETDFLQENLVIIAEPHEFAKALGGLTSILKGSVGDGAQSNVQYGRHRIMRIMRNGQSFSLAALDDLILMGQNERQVRRCIDTFDGDAPSFSDNSELIAFKNSLPAFDSLLVLPFKNIEEHHQALLGDHDFSDMAFFSRESSLLVGIRGLFYGAKRQKSIFKEQIIVHFDPQTISDSLRDQLVTRPIKPSRFFLASPNPMFYLWTNSFNVQSFLNRIGSGGKESRSDADIAHRLESPVIGKDFKHLALFGKEITVIAEQGPEKRPLPMPLAMLFIPVVDKDTLKAILLEILDTYDIPVNTEVYESIEYTYWSQSPQDGLSPLYGFLGEYFFLGNSVPLLQKIISTSGRGLSLFDIDLVKKNDPGVAERNNLVVYRNNIQVINILEIILKVFGTIAAIEDREFAKKAQVVINKIILPLLEKVKMFDTSVTRSYFTPDMIVVDTITNISPHP